MSSWLCKTHCIYDEQQYSKPFVHLHLCPCNPDGYFVLFQWAIGSFRRDRIAGCRILSIPMCGIHFECDSAMRSQCAKCHTRHGVVMYEIVFACTTNSLCCAHCILWLNAIPCSLLKKMQWLNGNEHPFCIFCENQHPLGVYGINVMSEIQS